MLAALDAPREVTHAREELPDVAAHAREFLGHTAFVHRLDLNVLAKLASDPTTPPQERRRAAEALGNLYLKALEVLGQHAQRAPLAGLWGAPARGRAARA